MDRNEFFKTYEHRFDEETDSRWRQACVSCGNKSCSGGRETASISLSVLVYGKLTISDECTMVTEMTMCGAIVMSHREFVDMKRWMLY